MWKAVHITYYDDEYDKLLFDGIKPILRQMQLDALIDRVYVLRMWDPTPHLAVHVEVKHEAAFQEVLKLMKDKAGRYLSKFPSRRVLSEQEQQKLTERWVGFAKDRKLTYREDNTIEAYKLTLPQGLHKHKAVLELLHSFYAYTYEIVLHEVERSRENSQTRYCRMLRMMAVNGWYLIQPPLISGYASPRMKVERYLQGLSEREFVKRQFEDADEQMSSMIDSALSDVFRAVDSAGYYTGSDTMLRLWSSARHELWKALYALAENEIIPLMEHPYGRTSAEYTAYCLLSQSIQAIMPLFQLDYKQQHLLEYLLMKGYERQVHSSELQLGYFQDLPSYSASAFL